MRPKVTDAMSDHFKNLLTPQEFMALMPSSPAMVGCK